MKELQDTQNEFDPRGVPIDRVGVRGVRFPVQVRDKNRGLQHTVATISLAVDLPHHYKGTHMSRFLEVLQAHGPELDVRRIHTIPGESCWCDARFEFPDSGGCIIYVHHSLDGRELAEGK